VNLGGDAPHNRWYPADTLKIIEWQPFAVKLRSLPKDMIFAATRAPHQNQDLILNDGIRHLGFGNSKLFDIYDVS
jgi:hypothetical protein